MTARPTLTLESDYVSKSRWYRTSVDRFINSGLFDVTYSDAIPTIRKFCRRDKYAGVFAVNGIQVLLDTWDSGNPAEQYLAEGFFDGAEVPLACGPLSAVRLVLKIQSARGWLWPSFIDRGIRVVPWPIMNSRPFPLGAFQYDPNANHRYQFAITGRNHRYGRQPYVEAVRDRDDVYCPAHRHFIKSAPGYAELLAQCKWGLILRGKPVLDGKNMREPEMLSCGMPLVLNYQPHYLFPFEPDVHYVYIQRPEDLTEKLPECDAEAFAARSREVWRDHYCPQAVSMKLIQLVGAI